MSIDVVYVAWNRLAFTRASFEALLANTDWDVVRQLVVYDDGSTDGTREYLEDAIRRAPCPARLVHLGLGSPVAAMLSYLAGDPADLFAKIDNDVLVPEGWLVRLLDVLDRHPGVELLGMEAGMTRVAGRDGQPWNGVYGWQPSSHIGGVGLMRSSAFGRGRRLEARGQRFGFTEFQHIYRPARGWITPDLPCPLLDRLPIEPWRSLSAEYVARGWQRAWPAYDPVWMEWAWDWFVTKEAA